MTAMSELIDRILERIPPEEILTMQEKAFCLCSKCKARNICTFHKGPQPK